MDKTTRKYDETSHKTRICCDDDDDDDDTHTHMLYTRLAESIVRFTFAPNGSPVKGGLTPSPDALRLSALAIFVTACFWCFV